MAQVLQLDNETIEVVKTSRRGSIGLKVEPDRIALMVPKQFSDLTIESLVANEKEWLLDQIRKHQAEMPKKLVLKSGHELLLFGEKILYKEDHKTAVKSLKVELDGACLTAYMNTARALKAPEATARKKVVTFLTRQLQAYLMEKVPVFAEQIAVSPTEVTVRNYKSRWGSCYPDGRIQFNWRLAMAPKAVIDYVIQHELCHLVHANHSSQYWQLVAEHNPEYEMHKQWLKENGTALIHF
ncbi:SprT family zinc-dependent metalloprotease [Hydrogenovibrio sp. 3SP14C1]|uniref:M48 family metallopeptidase n=1 Tax=Hydrogenovibrio sp. 3SP14C1 TaxID=3038774 RepID=UPI002416003C|nr:SprT family zinc-dependent metalloprotease [Hydrogenovibrio sp. 3SP14C1]MDG4812273.1 SprT family zinc-dependent metalloprotease [Hydrogenovibrio sp. 3SP14C1]